MAIAPWFLGTFILLTGIALAGLSHADTITRQRGQDGRLYFTNRAPSPSPVRGTSPAASARSRPDRVMPLVYTLARQYDI